MLAIMSLLLAVAVAAAVSCGSSISEEDFSALQRDLETEKTLAQSLESELSAERASVASLSDAVGNAEVRLVGLESELAQQRATVAANQERIDQARGRDSPLGGVSSLEQEGPRRFCGKFPRYRSGCDCAFHPRESGRTLPRATPHKGHQSRRRYSNHPSYVYFRNPAEFRPVLHGERRGGVEDRR